MYAPFLDRISPLLPDAFEEAVKNRRLIHMNPEVGFDTQDTEALVRAYLAPLGITFLPSRIGVMALIPGQDSSRILALRADMDALPIQEENDVPYCSQVPGKMHACGHDGHTAMLLGAAKVLCALRETLPCDVLLIFQPAEEGPNLGGARVMLADLREQGIDKRIERIYALHLLNDYPVGTVGTKAGSMASSTDEFDVTILGRGGHAGQPYKCIDALSIGAKVVTAVESYMSRRMDPFDQAICSVGVFEAGTAKNVVAGRAHIAGTIRCQREETRAAIIENLERITRGVCDAFGASCEIDILHGLPVLMNDAAEAAFGADIAAQVVGEKNVITLQNPMMGAEDFAYFTEAFPGAFLWIGSANEAKGLAQQNHQPHFDFDEDALAVGIKVLCGLALCR